MIQEANYFLLLLLVLTTALAYGHKKLSLKLQHRIPLVLVIYTSVIMVVNSSLVTITADIKAVQSNTLSNLIPAMIFLMLLQFKFTLFKQLGSKLLLAFFATTLSIVSGFTLMFYLFKETLFEHANASLAVLAASWSGGTANMLAVAKAINFDESALGLVLTVDTLLYGIWLLFLLSLVPFSHRFNHFTKAKENLYINIEDSCPIESNTRLYVRIIFISIAVSFVVNVLANLLPHVGFIQTGFLSILLATLAGVIASFTPLAKWQGTQSVAQAMLYLIISLIASKASFNFLDNITMFLTLASAILIYHALFMLLVAKLFKLDLFSIGVASLSHIGGIASAPILAASFHKNLVPVGIAMATMGYLLGTVVGLVIAYLLGVL